MSTSRVKWLLLVGGAAVVIGIIAAALSVATLGEHRSTAGIPGVATANEDIHPGSPAGNLPAPDFTLHDQRGRLTTLKQFRGKVVVLGFVDSRCTDLCPLMTESMVKALKLLGPAAAQVQLLGINANPQATKVADVAAYTRAHGMQGRWRFLTGSTARLKQVWKSYHVYAAANGNDAEHEPIIILIGPRGRERTIYLTQMSYEGIAQQAQVMAEGIARLLPGHPTVARKVSLQFIPPLGPSNAVRLTAFGPGAKMIVLGTGHPHLLLFFAGWLDEESNLPSRLAVLDKYAGTARRRGWPPPVAIDEVPTEVSPAVAARVLDHLTGRLHTPIIEDAQGRLGDGYGVQGLPWFVLVSPSGRILWHQEGWLSSAALGQQVSGALEEN